ncbi:hypothetical protein [Burkholderia multivorans]|nr:hypothetical protein [Burkholderia multivorans]
MTITSGGVSEAQCIAGFTGAGWILGALLTKTGSGANNVAVVGTIVGGLICNGLAGNGEDGDG